MFTSSCHAVSLCDSSSTCSCSYMSDSRLHDGVGDFGPALQPMKNYNFGVMQLALGFSLQFQVSLSVHNAIIIPCVHQIITDYYWLQSNDYMFTNHHGVFNISSLNSWQS